MPIQGPVTLLSCVIIWDDRVQLYALNVTGGTLNPLNFPRLTCNLKQTEQKENERENQKEEGLRVFL